MPIDAVGHRAACGHHEQRTRKYISPSVTQDTANHIAASQHHKPVNQINALSLLYLSGLLLPVLQHAIPSPVSLRQMHVKNNNTLSDNTTSFLPSVETCFSHQISHIAVSCSAVGATVDNSTRCRAKTETLPQPLMTPSWFSLPLAAATLPYIRLQKHEGIDGALIAQHDTGKRLIINVAKSFMENIEGLSESEIAKLEFEWLTASAHAPITLLRADLDVPLSSRNKRISFKDHERNIRIHITHHCAEEKEIFHSSGLSEGKMYIFIAQRINNPFRMLYDNIDGYEPSPAVQKIGNAVNFMVNILTLGVKDTLTSPIANYYRYKYYKMQGDDICATRQVHITLAQLGTSLDIDNGMRFMPGQRGHVAPQINVLDEFMPFHSRAEIFARDRSNNMDTEIFLLADRKGTDGQHTQVPIISQENNEIVIEAPEPGTSSSGKQTLVYDAQDNTWHDKQTSEVIPITLHASEGDNIIQVQGKKFPLRKNSEGHYEIMVKPPDGTSVYLPVYMEPLSKTWHLSKKQHRSVFTHFQQRLLARMRVNRESGFQYNAIYNKNPDIYGEGQFFEVRPVHADINSSPPLYVVVEMNGDLLPVKMIANKKHGTRYDIFNIKSPVQKSYPIEWDGERWILETDTSSFISSELAKRITPDMYVAEIQEQRLSVPDRQGIKWMGDRGYLKFKNKYIEILNDNGLFVLSAKGSHLAIKTVEYRYFPMTQQDLNERNRLLERQKRIDDFFDELKDQVKKAVIANVTVDRIETVAKLFFSPSPVQVTPITSTALDKKRYLIIVAGEQFIMDATQSGDDVFLLHGDAAELALSKYITKYTHDNMKIVAAIKRDQKEYKILSQSCSNIEICARELIEHGAILVEDAVNEVDGHAHMKKGMVIGHDDFFEISTFDNYLFPSLETAYQTLKDKFIPISAKYPEMVIIPGSLYIAEDISDDLRNDGVIYQEKDKQRRMDDIINFTAVVVPVFHRGKCIAIARKGEYLTAGMNNTAQHVNLATLDHLLAPSSVVKIHNVKNDTHHKSEHRGKARSGTVFVGKTLLPNENSLVQNLFAPPLSTHKDTNVSQLFSNEFMIDNDKFLLIVGDEYQQHGSEKPAVRNSAFPQHEDVSEANRYDWIIHLSAGSEIDPVLRAASDNYVQVDQLLSGKCVSDFNQRVCFTSYSEERKISLFEFISEH